ncbi:MAG TPA: tetratricopeptide repeat protein [Candidatus Competibacter sp.]|nr:tetratricopeptide repeat protein [Candidatus Competibacter sp.]
MSKWKPTIKKLNADEPPAKDERESLRKGRSLFREGRYDEAQYEFERLLADSPKSAGAHLGIGLVLLRRGLPAEAGAHFVEARKLDPLLPKAYVLEGQSLMEQGHFEPAMMAFRDALNLDPKSVKAMVGLGQSLLRQKRYSEALEPLQTALRYEPRKVLPRLLLAEVHSEQGRVGNAIAELRLALEIDPRHVRAATLLAKSLVAESDRDGAERVLHAVVAESLEESANLVQLGRAALELEFYPVAEQALLEALRCNPDRTAIRLSLVEALLANGKLEAAEQQVQKLPQNGQTASLVHKLLGDVHLRRKQFRLAVEEYRATVLHLPDNEQLLEELKRELSTSGETVEWEELAEALQPSVADRVAEETQRVRQSRRQRRDQR